MREQTGSPTNGGLDGIGERLREERTRVGISQRELARRLGLSPSLISQLENGISKPSVGTLYAIVTELGTSLDDLILGGQGPANGGAGPSGPPPSLVRPGERRTIDLASGVRWEELTTSPEGDVHFLEAIYEVGGASTPDHSLMRHHGREYGYVAEGRLVIQIDFEEYELGPGDAISFDATRPHRLFNKGDVPVRAIWCVAGRGADARTAED